MAVIRNTRRSELLRIWFTFLTDVLYGFRKEWGRSCQFVQSDAEIVGYAPQHGHIRDTLSLAELEISTTLIPDVLGREDVEIIGQPHPLRFGADGFMEDLKTEDLS